MSSSGLSPLPLLSFSIESANSLRLLLVSPCFSLAFFILFSPSFSRDSSKDWLIFSSFSSVSIFKGLESSLFLFFKSESSLCISLNSSFIFSCSLFFSNPDTSLSTVFSFNRLCLLERSLSCSESSFAFCSISIFLKCSIVRSSSLSMSSWAKSISSSFFRTLSLFISSDNLLSSS